jgi:hypothetical protein
MLLVEERDVGLPVLDGANAWDPTRRRKIEPMTVLILNFCTVQNLKAKNAYNKAQLFVSNDKVSPAKLWMPVYYLID